MSYSIDAIAEDCYEGTFCLINKLGIKDDKKLKEFEAAVTFAKASELEAVPIAETFDVAHYKAIHKYLFEDIYDWAGAYRTINMSKNGTDFANAENITALMDACFKRLHDKNYFRNTDFDTFIENTKPLLDYFQEEGILKTVDNTGTPEEIFARIESVI